MKHRLATYIGICAASATLVGAIAASPSAVAATVKPRPSLTGAEIAAGQLPTPKPIAWTACTDPGLTGTGAVCGYLTVPLDYSHPRGATIQLAVSMIKHTVPQSQYQGIMLTNPGGPGGSGLDLSTLGGFVPGGAGGYYDWIGFDPRGVGSSIPSISCDPTYSAGPRPDYTPSTPTLLNQWLKRTKTYDADCSQAGVSALLNHMTTVDSAMDMDYLRAALGQKQLNYYGFSYGTYLGQVYSTLFPHHLRRMVLDSTVDPRGVWYQDNLSQDLAFQRNLEIWFGWVAQYDNVFHLGKTAAAVQALWYREKALLTAHPAGGVVGPDEWTDIFLNAGYEQSDWPYLGDVFAGWVNNHDLADLEDAYQIFVGPTDDNEFAVYNAVQCTDVQWPGLGRQLVDNTLVNLRAPFETWGNFWFNAPCLYWPAAAHQPVRIDGAQTSSVLMIDETLDAATPYEGSLYVRSLYPNASLIAEPGGTNHADTLFGDACVDNQIASYLASGQRPTRLPGYRADTTCAPLPVPVPDSPSTSSANAGADRTAATLKLGSETAVFRS